MPVFEAAIGFAKAEGIVPAPESAHAVKVAVDEALACIESGDARIVGFNLSGHGHFDLAAFWSCLAGKLEDYEYPEERVKEAQGTLPEVPV